jgi:ketosteroid isomerase-like protein
MNESWLNEVSALEARRCKAMIEDDLATLEALFADDLMYTHSNALYDTKASYLQSLRSGAVKYKVVEREGIEMRVHGDAVFVTGKSRVVVAIGGEDKHVNLRYSNVWVKTAGGWKFALWHATPMPKGS